MKEKHLLRNGAKTFLVVSAICATSKLSAQPMSFHCTTNTSVLPRTSVTVRNVAPGFFNAWATQVGEGYTFMTGLTSVEPAGTGFEDWGKFELKIAESEEQNQFGVFRIRAIGRFRDQSRGEVFNLRDQWLDCR